LGADREFSLCTTSAGAAGAAAGGWDAAGGAAREVVVSFATVFADGFEAGAAATGCAAVTAVGDGGGTLGALESVGLGFATDAGCAAGTAGVCVWEVGVAVEDLPDMLFHPR
jgi:hypothetical protein